MKKPYSLSRFADIIIVIYLVGNNGLYVQILARVKKIWHFYVVPKSAFE